jgi:hypothetical protein
LQLTVRRETAAEENAAAYYPILDRVSQGYFDNGATEQQLYYTMTDTSQNQKLSPLSSSRSQFDRLRRG